jgi:hypothetical protein
MLEAWLSLATAIESNALATWLRSSAWGYPAVETLHIGSLALLFGAAVAFDLRLLGRASLLPVVSGLVLFMMQARTFAVMPLFFVKMGTVAIAVANTMIFHRGVFTSVGGWRHASRPPRRARIAAVVSLVCWTFALVCGRFLAYV